jgi:hypothetical protein
LNTLLDTVAIRTCEVVMDKTRMYLHIYIAMTFFTWDLGADGIYIIEAMPTAKEGEGIRDKP